MRERENEHLNTKWVSLTIGGCMKKVLLLVLMLLPGIAFSATFVPSEVLNQRGRES